ncbi:PH domain-containing protein [Micromonospora sp. NPDC048894]|uniref:PH domain-containing protein n=1 Tax=Micromonospora sp. NPDC048894 TaxID=3155493 RepID=UPI0033FAD840
MTDPFVPRVWKVSPLGRIGVLLLVPMVGMVTYFIRGGLIPSLLTMLAGVLIWFRYAFLPEVVLTATDVIVRNPGGKRQVRLPDVATVGTGYGGLTITTLTGEHLTAWAVQKSNLAKWTGRHTRADEVAATIIAASRNRAEPPSSAGSGAQAAG